jgi:hypothetical protein
MTGASIIGNIISPDVVQDTVIAHLKLWLPTYLCEIDEQRGLARGLTSWPKSWQVVPSFDNTLDGQIPAMLVICPGTAKPPIKEGSGSYRATYTVGVAALVKGPDQLTANKIAKRYGAAIAACVLQEKGRIHNNVHACGWEGDSYDDILAESDRTLSSATVHFSIEFSNVLNERLGPSSPIITPDPYEAPNTEPKKEPYAPWGVIPDEQHIHISVEPKGP